MTQTTFSALKRGDIIRLGNADFEVLQAAEEFGTGCIFVTLQRWMSTDNIVSRFVREGWTPVQRVA